MNEHWSDKFICKDCNRYNCVCEEGLEIGEIKDDRQILL